MRLLSSPEASSSRFAFAISDGRTSRPTHHNIDTFANARVAVIAGCLVVEGDMAREWVGVAGSSSAGLLKAVDTAVRGDDNLLRNNVSMSTACLWNRRKTSRQKMMDQRRTSMSEW